MWNSINPEAVATLSQAPLETSAERHSFRHALLPAAPYLPTGPHWCALAPPSGPAPAKVVRALASRPELAPAEVVQLTRAVIALTEAKDAALRDSGMARLSHALPRRDVCTRLVEYQRLMDAAKSVFPAYGSRVPSNDASPHEVSALPFVLRVKALVDSSTRFPRLEEVRYSDVERRARCSVQAAARHCSAAAAEQQVALWQDLVATPLLLAQGLGGFPRDSVIAGLDEALAHIAADSPLYLPLLELQERVIRPPEDGAGAVPLSLESAVDSGRLCLPATWDRYGDRWEDIVRALDGNAKGQRWLLSLLHRETAGRPPAFTHIQSRARLVLHAIADQLRRGEFKVTDERLWKQLANQEGL